MPALILKRSIATPNPRCQSPQVLAVKAVGSAHARWAYATAMEEFIHWRLHNGKVRINAPGFAANR